MTIESPFRRGSIGTRLTLLYTVIALAAVALFAGVTDWRLSANFAAEHLRFAQAKVAELQVDLDDARGDPHALLSEIAKETEGSALREYQARVLAPNGALLGETSGMARELPPSMFSAVPDGGLPAKLRLGNVGERAYALTAVTLHRPDGSAAAGVQLAVDVTRDEALTTNFRRALAAAFLLLAPLLALAGHWVAAQGLAPLTRITAAARSITPADLSARLPPIPPWPLELQALVQVFNAMLARIEEAFARLSRYSADLAHELRTPLANLSGELEVCLLRPREPHEYRIALESSLDECRRLSVLIENLLFMARAEHPAHALRCERFDALETCAWVAAQQAPGAAARDVRIRLDGEGSVTADPLLFRQALTNLLTNAVRHAPAGTDVSIRLRAPVDGGLEIGIRDEGEGIDASHLPNLFDRFYQVDAARRRGAGQGTGLGLSIVKTIVDLHDGMVQIESAPGAGTTVILRFPATAAASGVG